MFGRKKAVKLSKDEKIALKAALINSYENLKINNSTKIKEIDSALAELKFIKKLTTKNMLEAQSKYNQFQKLLSQEKLSSEQHAKAEEEAVRKASAEQALKLQKEHEAQQEKVEAIIKVEKAAKEKIESQSPPAEVKPTQPPQKPEEKIHPAEKNKLAKLNFLKRDKPKKLDIINSQIIQFTEEMRQLIIHLNNLPQYRKNCLGSLFHIPAVNYNVKEILKTFIINKIEETKLLLGRTNIKADKKRSVFTATTHEVRSAINKFKETLIKNQGKNESRYLNAIQSILDLNKETIDQMNRIRL